MCTGGGQKKCEYLINKKKSLLIGFEHSFGLSTYCMRRGLAHRGHIQYLV